MRPRKRTKTSCHSRPSDLPEGPGNAGAFRLRRGINPRGSGKRFLSPDTLPAPFGYSHVVDAPASRIIYISGQADPGVRSVRLTARDDIASVAAQLADLTRTVREMEAQLKTLRLGAETQRERADTQQERIDVAATELSQVSERLQAAARALRQSI